jgi:hypothetical protein
MTILVTCYVHFFIFYLSEKVTSISDLRRLWTADFLLKCQKNVNDVLLLT